jgi:hypothetical protein
MRCVMSMNVTTAPVTSSPSRTGNDEYDTGSGVPSLRQRVSSSMRTARPVRSVCVTGHSCAGYGVPSARVWWMRACIRAPSTSPGVWPSISAPARFRKVQRPSPSIPKIPSSVDSRSDERRRCSCSISYAASRSSISVTADAARSRRMPISSWLQLRGRLSMAHSAPSACPCEVTSGMPAYAMTESSGMARLSETRGSRRASSTTSGSRIPSVCWQKECDSGVSRDVA